jgi:hypothetical protein
MQRDIQMISNYKQGSKKVNLRTYLRSNSFVEQDVCLLALIVFALEKAWEEKKRRMLRTTTCLESTGLTLLSSQYIQPPLDAMNAVSEGLKMSTR